jgi:hypothetical protein
MRIRTAVAAALLLPSIASAQARVPRGIVGGRPQPAPLGPQPEPIARAIKIQRSHYSFETYPLLSRAMSPAISTVRNTSNWSYGTGTRIDYRLTQYISWTVDMTSSFMGGPVTSQTIEPGIRFRPDNWDHALRPFADARLGYEFANDQYSTGSDLGIGPASSFAPTSRYSRGFGAIAGAGVEYSLTSTMSLTTAVSAMRSSMAAYSSSGLTIPTDEGRFHLTTYRLALGFRYNPVHSFNSFENSVH